jgi:lipid-binding SYLF domain-containing protein
MKLRLRGVRKNNLTIFAIIALLAICFAVLQPADTYAASAKEIDVSVDVALEDFNKHVKGAKEFLKTAQGVLVFPSVIKAGFGI